MMKENKSGEQDKFSPTELSAYDNHPAEIASELYETEHNNALRVHTEQLLKDINDAIMRLNKGTYGKCAFCGKDIGEERLTAIPYTRLCIDCEKDRQSEVEARRGMRPNEEIVMEAIQGKAPLVWHAHKESEGMDQLYDLMKYGSADSPQDVGRNRDLEGFYTNDIDTQGIVDEMDKISNEQYKRQLP